MSVQRALRAAGLAGAAFLLAGCGGGPSVAPVSGKVTLDGKPLANAKVSFQPMATDDNFNPGPGSLAVTRDDGTYELRLVTDNTGVVPGAVVGKHRVVIRSGRSGDVEDTNNDSEESESVGRRRRRKIIPDPVPLKYNRDSQLTFEVPRAGSKQANFDLTSQ